MNMSEKDSRMTSKAMFVSYLVVVVVVVVVVVGSIGGGGGGDSPVSSHCVSWGGRKRGGRAASG